MPLHTKQSYDSYLQSAIICFTDKSLSAFSPAVTSSPQWHEVGYYTNDYDHFSDQDNNHSVNFLLLLAAIHGEI